MKQFKDIFTIDEQEIIIKDKPLPTRSLLKEALKLSVVILVVITLSWGISSASKSDLESATENFSVIGTVSFISEDTVSLIKARGSDTTVEDLYNLNIQYLDKVETNTYDPLIISDIHVGDTIIAQGLTNGSIFFIKRIVSFSSIPFEIQEVVATTTPEVATSTEDIATSTDEGTSATGDTTESTPDVSIDDTATSTDTSTTTDQAVIIEDDISIIDEPATSTDDTSSSTSSIIDTVTTIVDDVIDTVVDTITNIIDTVTGTSTPEEPVVEEPIIEEPVIEEPIQTPEEIIIEPQTELPSVE